MRLSELLELYLASHPMWRDSAKLVARSIRRCTEVLGDVDVNMITELDVVRLRQTIDQQGVKSRAASACKWLRILLNEAWRLRILKDPPRVWPNFRETRELPDSWSEDEAARLLTVATAIPGELCGIPAGLWFRAWLLVAWDTALRASQMFRIHWEDVNLDAKTIVVRAQSGTKSYRAVVKYLSEESQSALCSMQEYGREGLVFKFPDWPKSRRDFFTAFRLICYLANVPAPREKGLQLTHKLRRSTITAAARKSLDAAQKHAGHASLRTTLEHYVDPRRLSDAPPVTPLKPQLRIFRVS